MASAIAPRPNELASDRTVISACVNVPMPMSELLISLAAPPILMALFTVPLKSFSVPAPRSAPPVVSFTVSLPLIRDAAMMLMPRPAPMIGLIPVMIKAPVPMFIVDVPWIFVVAFTPAPLTTPPAPPFALSPSSLQKSFSVLISILSPIRSWAPGEMVTVTSTLASCEAPAPLAPATDTLSESECSE